MHFKLYNTNTKQIEPFIPADPDSVTFYSCGPTVYDDAHIGNFRSFLAADLLRRWVESPICNIMLKSGEIHAGPRTVTHVMNITDVGHMTDDDNADGAGQDKMELAAQRITESKKDGQLHKAADIDPSDPRAIAAFYEQRFKDDAIKLGLKVASEAESDPSLMPRASDHVEHMKSVIADLLDKGDAYAAGMPGSRAIYFNTAKFPDYGTLSGNTLDQLKGGAGGRVDDAQQSEKNHPADFLLWKEDATHTMKWDAPDHKDCNGWDQGYPGWHIECTAMALNRLVPGGLDSARANHASIDLHSGGEDNIFPHHECEIAQSCCFTGAPDFARHWFHARFLKVEGEKMSKSKGTMYTLSDLTDKGIDPAAVRLELIKTHYRANADFSMQGLKDSGRMINRWRNARYEIARRSKGYSGIVDLKKVAHSHHHEIQRHLSDDLNIAGVIGEVNRMVDSLLKYEFDESKYLKEWTDDALESEWSISQYGMASFGEHIPDIFCYTEPILGVLSLEKPKSQDTGIALYQPGVTPSDEIESLLAQRAEAKKSKDFATADAIRDQLSAMNLSIMDKPGGKVEVAPAN